MSKSSSSQRSEPPKRKRTVISCTECHRRKQKCDRQYPCCNCIRRQKEDLCQYKAIFGRCQVDPRTSHHSDRLEHSNGDDTVHLASPTKSSPQRIGSDIESSLEGFGYSSQDNHNSMGLLKATELHQDQDSSLAQSHPVDKPSFQNDVHRKYTELVRRLPPQALVNTLTQTFFTLVNWQYDLLDNEIFQEQLKAWGRVSYSSLREGLTAMTPETLAFPALLLQVLAQALLVHSPHDQKIKDLMVMAGMTFHDLAAEYSNTGNDILLLLGKGSITIPTVQAGLLRASYLKHSGSVIDAWHALGVTIRDAQEIGLHNGRSKHKHHCSDTEVKTLLGGVGQKVWVVLHIWDAHMAVVLGRPMATDLHLESLAHTIEDDERRRELFAHWQTEHELPRPFDVIIAGYVVAYRYFKDVHYLERHDARSLDYLKVEQIHAKITSNLELLPSWCRLENPSLRFDRVHNCQWLPAARQGLYSLIHLVLLTLHRPHVFTKTKSRLEALKAGESILRAQEQLFEMSEAHQQCLFTPVYASFDAIVLIAAIYLTFPNENHERRAKCIEAVERGISRLDAVGRSNRMARSAHGVASSLYDRLKHRFRICESIAGAGSSEGTPIDNHRTSSNMALSGFSFNTVQPPRPVHDLFDDHLSSAQISIYNTPPGTSFVDSSGWDSTDNWGFEGVFTDTSFWGVLNEFDSGT